MPNSIDFYKRIFLYVTPVRIIVLWSKFFPMGQFKWIGTKEFVMNKYTENSSKGFPDLKYPKKIGELNNDYTFAPGNVEIKEKMLPKNQLMIADLYNVPIGNVKILVPNVFNKGNFVLFRRT